jgi:hypothetical protein
MTGVRDGGCLCGAVRYRLCDRPLTLYACHCSDCQRHVGAAFGLTLLVPRDAVILLRGEPAIFEAVCEGGRIKRGRFCARCATRLWGEPVKAPTIAALRPGTLDDRSWLRPVAHIWTSSAQPWLTLPDDVLLFPEQPPDVTELIRLYRGGEA